MIQTVRTNDDLAEGAMRVLEAGGRKVLLTRIEGQYYAVDAICPHAGAPLVEGALTSGVVTCPWHKASFCVMTGVRTAPPAVDDLQRFALHIADGVVHVDVVDEPSASAVAEASDSRCMAIVGAGAAGALAAQTLRKAGFSGRIVLIGREDHLPYDRTVLSKYALSGKKGGEKTPLQDEAFYVRQRIERVGRSVESLDPLTRTITFADGTQLRYDAALLATGGIPRPLDVPGHDLDGVHTLRTIADANAIVGSAAKASHAVVIGAGFIGLEAAASLRERGLDVSVVAPQSAPLERQLGSEVGNVFRRVHEGEGVRFYLGHHVAALEGNDGRVARVRLKSGIVLPADLVIVGQGIKPATDLLRGCARREDGSLEVDRHLRVADNLYAAGDIAAFPLCGDGPLVRVEHWRVAEQHGEVAAVNMMGLAKSYDAVPVFWTIHFLKRLDYIGHAETWDEIVIDGDLDKPAFLAFYVEQGHVKSLAGWGRDRQMAAAVPLMSARRDWAVGDLRRALA